MARSLPSRVLLENLEERLLLSALPFSGPELVLTHGLMVSTCKPLASLSPLTQPGRPAPAPTSPPVATTPVDIAIRTLSSYSQLVITGTTGNDSIVVSQSGSILTITANGTSRTLPITFSELVIYDGAGNDTLTVNASVQLPTLIYGGTGNDTIKALGKGRSTIVTIGGTADTVTGNGLNTSFWADTSDNVAASAAEVAAGRVHKVAAFYQPWTTSTASPDYIPLTLAGQNLRDPSDSGTTTRLTNDSFWGLSPTMSDINQGYLGDCYYLATLQSLANQCPDKLRELAVDLGDGTYAVQFTRNGRTSFVRVDGDLPATGKAGSLKYAEPGSAGSIWAPIMEKAYAFFRTAGRSFASLNAGWMGDVFSDFGIASTALTLTRSSASSLYTLFATALAKGKAVTVASNSTITGGAPVVGNHAYSLVAAARDAQGNYTFTVRNPWGVDGAGHDSNPYDGLVTLTASQLLTNFTWSAMMA